MPHIEKSYRIKITPQEYLEACTVEEIKETQRLISTRYQAVINQLEIWKSEKITPPQRKL